MGSVGLGGVLVGSDMLDSVLLGPLWVFLGLFISYWVLLGPM